MVHFQTGLCIGTVLLQVVRVFGTLKCLGCVDVSDPSLCSHIKHCQNGEVCVTEKFQEAGGRVIFNLGCRKGATCSSQQTATTGQPGVGITCTDCCNSDLCNSNGCGTKGYNSSTDGPVCYNCPRSSDVSTCEEIKVCRKDEACFIQEENIHFFSTRCIQKALCSVGGGPNPVGRRWIGSKRDVKCVECCVGNLCNDVCNQNGASTSTSTTPTTIATTAMATTPSHVCRDSRGTEFVLMFIPNTHHDLETIQLVLTSLTGQSGIKMTSSLNGISKNISLSSQSFLVNLNKDIVHVNHSLILNKGLHIQSTEPISVHGYSTYGPYGSSGAFTALPVNMLGTDYIAVTYPTGTSQIGIVATKDNTNVTVVFNTTKTAKINFIDQVYRDGDTATFLLNALDTVRIKAFDEDLTGTTIHSNNPVGVLAGDECVGISKYGYCDFIISMFPPVNKWGNFFIIPSINSEKIMILRIVPSVKNTIIELENNGTQSAYTTNKTVEVGISIHVLTFVYCSQPCLVVQFSSPDRKLDPFMAIVPPQDQFSNLYVMGVSTLQNYSNHVSITIETKDVSGLQYNGKQLSGDLMTALDRNNTEWTSITMQLKGHVSHVINHTSSDVYFGVTQYGYKDYEAFAFPVAYGNRC